MGVRSRVWTLSSVRLGILVGKLIDGNKLLATANCLTSREMIEKSEECNIDSWL